MERMSETFAHDSQVNMWMDKMSFLAAEEPVSEEEISEPVARERKMYGGH